MSQGLGQLASPPHADPPTTNRSRASAPYWQVLGEHGANYVDAATPASLPTPASPPVSRRDGLMRALACPVLWGGPRPLPDKLPATRRDGLASELLLLGSRGGPHRTTQPHTIAAVLSEDLVGFNSQRQPT